MKLTPKKALKALFRSVDIGWRYKEKDALLGNIFGCETTRSGVQVDNNNATASIAYYSGVNVLCKDVATLPAILNKENDDGFSERDYKNPIYGLLHDQANEFTTASEFWYTMMWCKLNRGCGYAYIEREGPQPVALYLLDPTKISIVAGRNEFEAPAFKYNSAEGKTIYFAYTDILKLENPFYKSAVHWLREGIGLSIAQQNHGAEFFGNFAAPRGVISLKGTLGEDETQLEKWKQKFIDTYSGPGKSWGVAVLQNGATFQTVSLSNVDAQWLEGTKDSAIRILGGIGVPPHRVGMLDQAHYNNIEQQNSEYLQLSLMFHLIGAQQSVRRDLFTTEMRKSHKLEFLTDALLRADTKERYEAYAQGRLNGWLSPNDIRRKENMNPISAKDGGDSYIVPLNAIPANMLGKEPQKQQPAEKKHELNGAEHISA